VVAGEAEEWSEGGYATTPARLFALCVHGEIVAAANLTNWRMGFDDVGLVVHPEHRGRGSGVAIGSHVATVAAQAYGIACYRARKTNDASVVIQSKLGFRVYCEQTAIRRID